MSIVENAKLELDAIRFGAEDTEVMLDILRRFFAQWNSGGAVWAVAPVLQRLIAGKPLSPLTGEDSEWTYVAADQSGPLYQNKRCSTVFKDSHGAYDIDSGQRLAVTFPYWPVRAEVADPVVEFNVP